ncbi:MAG: ATP-dependent Clp protease ATP-binding subunit [Clostridia bacterium]|nr:ATP-dependent Clp protease ATP-binding subunit [Clostridia bacterium]
MQTETLQSVYEFAGMFARNKKVSLLEAQHVLYGLVNVENEAKKYLTEFGLTVQNLEPKEKGRGGILHESAEIMKLNARAALIASQLGEKDVNCVHILVAILSMKNTYAFDKIAYLLGENGKTPEQLFSRIIDDIPNREKLLDLGKNRDAEASLEPVATADCYARKVDNNSLPYGVDLTEKASMGGFDPVIGRDFEIERVIQTLTRRSKNNPVLVGEPGVGKTAVVEGLANCIAMGHVPVELQGKRLVELDIAGMIAGTRFRGDFEERLTNLISEVVSAGDVILFIDEIHNMVGAGGTAEGTLDAAEILKPALARGELRVIGATTTREYRQYIEKDPALERRFQPITVDEPTPELAVKIVKGVKSKYEKHHGVIITNEAIDTAVQLSVRYVTDRFLPDKAFDIIDEACSKLKISAYAVPPRLVELSNELKTLTRKIDLTSPQDGEQYNVLQRKYNELRFEYEHIQGEYKMQLQEYQCKLTAADVRLVVSQMTGIPVAELSRAEKDKLVHLEEELAKRVIGQSEAVKAVARAVRRQRAGLKDPNRPIGSFIFVGPTGVGKTELAKALANCLFGADSEVIRIDMSEYMDKQSTAKLIGAPPGYAGYEESGYLTEKVQRKPYSVVLFDEIEKAHPDVFNLLLQILDEGRLTNSHGKTIDFRNTVIILTSNIGVTDVNNGVGFGLAGQDEIAAMRDSVERSLKKFFRPEFLNRLDEIVVFSYLSKSETSQIAELLCYNLYKRLRGIINLRFTDSAIETLANEGYDKFYGARPLKRVIQRKIEDVLAEKLLCGDISKGDTIIVDSMGDKIFFKKQ